MPYHAQTFRVHILGTITYNENLVWKQDFLKYQIIQSMIFKVPHIPLHPTSTGIILERKKNWRMQ